MPDPEKPETVNAVVTKTRSPNVAGDLITMTAEEFAAAEGKWVERASERPAETRVRAPTRTR